MAGLEISKNDVYETGLKYDYVEEKLENHKDLKDLYGQVMGLGEQENKKIEDLSGLKNYLNSIKDKNFDEIKQEGATLSFAVQLFLKSQKLYDGKIDGLYMTAGQPDSKTRAAVREFQRQQGFTGKDLDGWAGSETIKKMLEKMNNPENGIDKLSSNSRIKSEFDKLTSAMSESVDTENKEGQIVPSFEDNIGKILMNTAIKDKYNSMSTEKKVLFGRGGLILQSGDYVYVLREGSLLKTSEANSKHIGYIDTEILLSDGNWSKYKIVN